MQTALCKLHNAVCIISKKIVSLQPETKDYIDDGREPFCSVWAHTA